MSYKNKNTMKKKVRVDGSQLEIHEKPIRVRKEEIRNLPSNLLPRLLHKPENNKESNYS